MSVTKKRLLLLGLLVVCTGAIIGYREYNRKPASLTTQTPLYTMPANQLASEFSANEATANKKFLGKPIEVTGIVAAETKETTILLKTDSGISVSCSMDSLEYIHHATIKTGDQVKLRGICTGLLMDVELNRCVIIE